MASGTCTVTPSHRSCHTGPFRRNSADGPADAAVSRRSDAAAPLRVDAVASLRFDAGAGAGAVGAQGLGADDAG
ncbi:hypothetical protein, partial [Streptomyces parvus]|uniref:hypothetical protein n=1 Tax=Streptomyces parvus TaxID=66428 RepID=UPI001AD7A3CD